MDNTKVISESFVNEILKSSSWDIARARPEPVIEEATEEQEVVEEEAAELTAADLAQELLENLDEEIIREFVNLLHAVALNESEDEDETDPDAAEGLDESLVALFNVIEEAYEALVEEYDISEATEEDILTALTNSLDEEDLEDYEAEEIMEALILYLNEDEETIEARKAARERTEKVAKKGGLTALGKKTMMQSIARGEQDPKRLRQSSSKEEIKRKLRK